MHVACLPMLLFLAYLLSSLLSSPSERHRDQPIFHKLAPDVTFSPIVRGSSQCLSCCVVCNSGLAPISRSGISLGKSHGVHGSGIL